MAFEQNVKAFGMTNMLIESEIDQLERRFDVKLRSETAQGDELSDIEKAYFPQFTEALRAEAASMARSYELFYCLEKTIRSQITDLLSSVHGDSWWNDKIVPQHIFGEVKKRITRERESGITPRSIDQLDYTNFGELGEIIKANWNIFASVFNNVKAVEKVMSNLNSLRNPIAHCSVLAEDERLRLDLSLRDWFRLAE
ncbi:Swt1 family HEPN domain-containing protein [Pseudomonas kurunegalensis]|uniref:Swt1 family HEPN domain-containing protein n=1 Tax=Pseudomonas kurunegalensis TaxID=485880 RepID=UPI0025703596|nr:Swt1 family HEPN domain-containing protein [Pseudomonas kurunegalensis]WJD60817.1 Swt1 family HEPN domain-containing protein [Pseudomonas kurunegalensis]